MSSTPIVHSSTLAPRAPRPHYTSPPLSPRDAPQPLQLIPSVSSFATRAAVIPGLGSPWSRSFLRDHWLLTQMPGRGSSAQVYPVSYSMNSLSQRMHRVGLRLGGDRRVVAYRTCCLTSSPAARGWRGDNVSLTASGQRDCQSWQRCASRTGHGVSSAAQELWPLPAAMARLAAVKVELDVEGLPAPPLPGDAPGRAGMKAEVDAEVKAVQQRDDRGASRHADDVQTS